MAIPTISSVSPATGTAAGGSVIELVGTGFRTPVLSMAIPTPTISPTVSVLINGRAARRVDVISSTLVRILTPRLWHQDPRVDQYAAVDIVLSNLDPATGLPVAGESVTRIGGFTYERWVLGAPRQESPTARILEEFIWALSLEVERNTAMATHVDYGEEGSAVVIDEAQLPSINLTVAVLRDVEMAQFDNYPEEIDVDANTAELYEGARTMMLVCDLLLAAGTVGEALHLCQAVQDFVQVNPELDCAADPTLYPGLEDLYPVELWKDAQQVSNPNNSSLIAYSIQIRVRGIRTLPDDPTMSVKKIQTFRFVFGHVDASTGVGDGAPAEFEI